MSGSYFPTKLKEKYNNMKTVFNIIIFYHCNIKAKNKIKKGQLNYWKIMYTRDGNAAITQSGVAITPCVCIIFNNSSACHQLFCLNHGYLTSRHFRGFVSRPLCIFLSLRSVSRTTFLFVPSIANAKTELLTEAWVTDKHLERERCVCEAFMLYLIGEWLWMAF